MFFKLIRKQYDVDGKIFSAYSLHENDPEFGDFGKYMMSFRNKTSFIKKQVTKS
jgi:hypothetical protein